MATLSKASKDDFDSPVDRLLASVANLRQQPTSKGAHFYRTSLRRFQAWSDVFHPKLEKEHREALKYLERLRKATGKLRDSEVHLELLDKFRGVDEEEKSKLERSLKKRRNGYETELKLLMRDPLLSSLWRVMRVLDEQPEAGVAPQPGISEPIEGMSQLALGEYRNFVQRHPQITPENLHEYRLECKRFRYTAELAGDTSEAKRLVDIWKQVQDVIGDWHDFSVLTELAGEAAPGSSLHEALAQRTAEKFAASIQAIQQAEAALAAEPRPVPKMKPGKATVEILSSIAS